MTYLSPSWKAGSDRQLQVTEPGLTRIEMTVGFTVSCPHYHVYVGRRIFQALCRLVDRFP